MTDQNLTELAKLLRYFCLVSTTAAQSGHATSSLSAVELMTALFFGGVLHYDAQRPEFANNDRVIFSKGHAAPLFYALWAAAGKIPATELTTLRQFTSRLEGHPTMQFPYTEVPTGSLGQGLSVGVGMALNAKYVDKLEYKTYVLLGDSEMAEGANWEAIQLAAHYKLGNLIGILDVNGFGQRGETLLGPDTNAFAQRIGSFGWKTLQIDGHDLTAISEAYVQANASSDQPTMIIARTIKGKGIPEWEGKPGFHAKVLSTEQLQAVVAQLEPFDRNLIGKIALPADAAPPSFTQLPAAPMQYTLGQNIATKQAYGNALVRLAQAYPHLLVLDAEVSNSTTTELFQKQYPDRFFEMFIAEQNMIGVAAGLARRGQLPCVSSFAAFLTRTFDQLRMTAYAGVHLIVDGAYAGVSIGKDGVSQMGLEDIAMARSLFGSTVLYPSDAVATEKLLEVALQHTGICYLRTTRQETPVIYAQEDSFQIGGSKTLKSSDHDQATVISAGITLHEALRAYDLLTAQGISIRVIDLYSIKPIDVDTLMKAARETKHLIVVEDHYPEGGIAEAVRSAISDPVRITSLAVRQLPHSGTPQELIAAEQISAEAIVKSMSEKVA